MLKRENWSKENNPPKEFIIGLPNTKQEARIRIKMIKKQKGKSKKKDINIFSVGLEAVYNGKWYVIVRHCNFHSKQSDEFHTHNKYHIKLSNNGNYLGRCKRKLVGKKVPSSIYRWCVKDIRTYHQFYLKNFLKIIKELK